MKKKYMYAAPRSFAVTESPFWFLRSTAFLLLLFLPGISCEDLECASDNLFCQILRRIGDSKPPNMPSSLGEQPCEGFRCGSSECLEFDQVCNQVPECADGSDENPAACLNRTCNAVLDFDDLKQLGSGLVRLDSVVRSWRCDDGECISDVYRCDGRKNCRDASDETALACFDRSCNQAQFTCTTGQCIRKTDLCNGKTDCFDGSDEDRSMCRVFLRSRPRTVCPARVLNYCADRTQCYHKRQQCDGEVNCFDGSDEDPETCGYPEAPPPITTPPTTPAPPPITTPPTTPAPPPITTPPTTPAPPVTTPVPPTPPPSIPIQVKPVTPVDIEFPYPAPEVPTLCRPPSCPCTVPGMEHVCLPCRELNNVTDTCIKLRSGDPVCSVQLLNDQISMDILTCGGQGLENDFGMFERNSYECVTSNKVPVLTVVVADCWGTAILPLRCHSDGTWGEYGVMTSDTERMGYICQPRHINSPLCGRTPRYRSTGAMLDLHKFYYSRRNLHPWLVGLKKWERYECSATLITSTWLITAAHCVIKSQESHNETLDPRNLRVQLTSQRRSDRFVSEVVVHPQYIPGKRPFNDIALIRLEGPLLLSGHRYPACVDLNGDGFLTSPFARTFSRPNGENTYSYDTVLQQVDPACHSPVSRCRTLRIEQSQFCGVDLEKEDHLPGGSSGGPFMQNLGSDHAENWAVSGIVSFSVEKQSCGLPFTIYTAVNVYKEWILDVIYGGPLY